MKTIAVIPARWASTRFPGKPLADIFGKSMIRRVYEQVSKISALQAVCVATDDERIARHVADFGGLVQMTSSECLTGTDRCAEALEKSGLSADVVINVQGDEPFIKPGQIEEICRLMEDTAADIGTLCKKIETAALLFDPNVVKLVKDSKGKALYFSRQAIPFVRGKEASTWPEETEFFRHIGMYAYKTEVLKSITKLPEGQLEKAECLEQLRWLQAGCQIFVSETAFDSLGIDTPEDLRRINPSML
jgi:3-deoxy-manno-octulosonate cytidylyltransferase (CMP-KDO synthetase)